MNKTLLFWMMFLVTACVPQTMDVYGTAVVAQGQLQVSGMMLTGTAQDSVLHIAETQAAWVLFSTQAAASEMAAIKTDVASWTPTPTLTPSITPSPTPNIPSTLEVAKVIAIQTTTQLDTEQKEISNTFWAIILPIFLLAVLLVLCFWMITYSRDHRHKVHQSNAPGDKSLIEDVVTGELIDMDASPNYSTGRHIPLAQQMFEQWLEKNYGFKPLLPHITDERQDAVKSRDQMIDLRTRAGRLPRALVDAQSVTKSMSAPLEQPSALDMFPLPAWEKLVEYPFQAGGEFPFGSFAQELARIDVNKYPHLGLVGPTGCGKSRLFLRPFIASALASGNRVIVLGDMVDFIVFKIHPNATLVPVYQITKPSDAAQYVHALRVINGEMERRFQQLASQGLSTWERMGGENTLIVLDELGPNLDILDDTNPQAARALRGFLSILISKGRKAGFNFVFASTRAVGLKKQLSQVSTIAFRLKDTDEERYAFGQSGFGAERLPESYFLSKVGSTVRMTGSFNPSDEELGEFLMRHTTKALDRPTWIEGVFKPAFEGQELPKLDVEELPMIAPTEDDVSTVSGCSDDEEVSRILELHRRGMSNTKIVYEIWGTSGPSFSVNMARVKDVLVTAATATAAQAPNLPINGALAA